MIFFFIFYSQLCLNRGDAGNFPFKKSLIKIQTIRKNLNRLIHTNGSHLICNEIKNEIYDLKDVCRIYNVSTGEYLDYSTNLPCELETGETIDL